jgi:purine-cytosine permease-like protein
MDNFADLSVILSIVGVLVVLTNIVVQVLKKLTWDKLPTNALAVVIAMVLTLAAFFAYCQIKSIAVAWYMVAAAVVLGFMVAYAAMFGFDKLKEALAQSGNKQ